MRRLLHYQPGKAVRLVSGRTLDKRGCPHSPHSWSPQARDAECIASAQGDTGGGPWEQGIPQKTAKGLEPSSRAVVLRGRQPPGHC